MQHAQWDLCRYAIRRYELQVLLGARLTLHLIVGKDTCSYGYRVQQLLPSIGISTHVRAVGSLIHFIVVAALDKWTHGQHPHGSVHGRRVRS